MALVERCIQAGNDYYPRRRSRSEQERLDYFTLKSFTDDEKKSECFKCPLVITQYLEQKKLQAKPPPSSPLLPQVGPPPQVGLRSASIEDMGSSSRTQLKVLAIYITRLLPP